MVLQLRQFFVSVVLVVAVSVAAALGEGQGETAGVKVLVLRNGRVIRGDITRLGDRAVVVLPNGGQVQLPARDIAIEAQSIEEAYELLRAALQSPEQIDGHLELATWCMREGLHSQATSELLVAFQIKPDDPRIDQISKQLDYVVSAKSAAPKKSQDAKTIKPATAQELDLLARAMPKVAVEQFTSSVQMVLLNRCGTAQCHDNNSKSALRLMRPAKGERFWRRMTLRNLHSTKLQIDARHPQESPLLKMAVTPHGGSQTAVFEEEDGQQFANLKAWVALATNSPAPRREAAAAPPSAVPATLSRDIDARPLANTDDLDAEASGGTGAEDPFDPGAFNEP
jgi:hypothetical protein